MLSVGNTYTHTQSSPGKVGGQQQASRPRAQTALPPPPSHSLRHQVHGSPGSAAVTSAGIGQRGLDCVAHPPQPGTGSVGFPVNSCARMGSGPNLTPSLGTPEIQDSPAAAAAHGASAGSGSCHLCWEGVPSTRCSYFTALNGLECPTCLRGEAIDDLPRSTVLRLSPRLPTQSGEPERPPEALETLRVVAKSGRAEGAKLGEAPLSPSQLSLRCGGGKISHMSLCHSALAGTVPSH